MATKKLARTVIEGGRTHYCSWRRRHSHGQRRMCDRALQRSPREYDDLVWSKRPHVTKRFFDKLGPARRWLGSHVGLRWNDVHEKIMATFDTRTLAGRHIVFDHLLGEVNRGEPDRRWQRFYVDDSGILRRYEQRYRGSRVVYVSIPEEVLRWCDGRRVGRRGDHLYWCVPVIAIDPSSTETVPRRQHRSLDAKERQRFEALPVAVQQLLYCFRQPR